VIVDSTYVIVHFSHKIAVNSK